MQTPLRDHLLSGFDHRTEDAAYCAFLSMLTEVQSDAGQVCVRPSGVRSQSMTRISAPIHLAPARKEIRDPCAIDEELFSASNIA